MKNTLTKYQSHGANAPATPKANHKHPELSLNLRKAETEHQNIQKFSYSSVQGIKVVTTNLNSISHAYKSSRGGTERGESPLVDKSSLISKSF